MRPPTPRRLILLIVLAACAGALAAALTGGSSRSRARAAHGSLASAPAASVGSTQGAPSPGGSTPAPRRVRYAVGVRVVRLTDYTRTIERPGAAPEPRTLYTVVRYPAAGAPLLADVRDAPPARVAGGFPLIVFGHGFAVTPATYARLLEAWARAGFVVAAPAFPLENGHAPGGPDESDLPNQPRDMSFVISRMIALARGSSSPLAGLVDRGRIAVAGQSDGGDTALAVAYDSRFRDARVRAAVILSGAEIPGIGAFAFPASGPPLLATQGTADTVNPPELTETFFAAAHPPKYLLRLLGAEHLPPYTYEQPQLSIVARVSIAFLEGYLEGNTSAMHRLAALSDVAQTASLTADP